jgi:hypothetical protein
MPIIWAAAAVMILASCGGTGTGEPGQIELPTATEGVSDSTSGVDSTTMSFSERMDTIDVTVAAWRSATSVEVAHVAAETVANLIVGPNGPGYGDRNGDGFISGETTVGVLPGLDGTPAGLATPLAANECVSRDVLGGTWTDPGMEWGAMQTAIDDWRPDNNTMPTLASHPMRTVGWATFTLESNSLDEAREYAGHAKLHVDIALRAPDC